MDLLSGYEMMEAPVDIDREAPVDIDREAPVDIDRELWLTRYLEARRSMRKRTQTPWTVITRLNLEITDWCNTNCIMCNRDGYLAHFGKPTFMKTEDAIKIIDSVNTFAEDQFKGLKRINVGIFGEATGHPGLPDVIAQASKYAEPRISTNVSLLDEDLSRRLLEFGLRHICFSIDECEKKRYEAIRGNLKWETILENANNFMQIRDEGGYNCNIEFYPVLMRENEDHVEEIKDFWNYMANPRVMMSPETPIGRNPRVQPWFDTISKPHCLDMFTVRATGAVVPCCLDIFNDILLGDILRETPYEIFYGQATSDFQNRIRYPKVLPEGLPLCCQLCTYIPQFQPKNQTVTNIIKGFAEWVHNKIFHERVRVKEWHSRT